MRILSWVQGRVNGKNEKNKMGSSYKITSQYNHKEEFEDWPQSFLAIGTFGNAKQKKDADSQYITEEVQYLADSILQVNSFLKETNVSFPYKFNGETYHSKTQLEGTKSLLSDTSLNRIPYLESESTALQRLVGDTDNLTDDDLYPDIKSIAARTKDVQGDRRVFKSNLVSFLIKRFLAYRGGFAPTPLRDPIAESRTEILKAMLQKKISLPNFYPNTSVRKYLRRKPANGKVYEKQLRDRQDDGLVWDKTDSEYIVLEI